MGSADGSTIALVLLVAVDGLNPTDFFVYPIPGMTLCVQGNTVGYLYFCATHVGNEKFVNWFTQQIAIPSIQQSQALCSQSSAFEELPPHAFVTCDGEAVVLEEVFNVEARNLLVSKNIDFGKVFASCSGIYQPSDVSPLFRASKAHLRSLISKIVIPANPLVQSHILPAFEKF